LAVLANRHTEFLAAGARVYSVTADEVRQSAAVMEKLALPFPLLSDPSREDAITPLGFADPDDPRLISLPGTVILAPGGEEVWRYTGRDYADRPAEDVLLQVVAGLGLPPTSQEPPAIGEAEASPKAVTIPALRAYLRGARAAVLALRGRFRELGDDFRANTKGYVQMADRYLEALDAIETRRS